MSIFGKIMGAIFGTKAEAAEPAGGAGSAAGGAGVPMVDVAPILDKAVAAKGEKLLAVCAEGLAATLRNDAMWS